jgi:hypothetical protein
MHTYLLLRRGVAATAAELDAALTRLRSFEERPHALEARWLRSYALRDADGRFGLACVFQADAAATLERHAELTGMAADEVLPVCASIVARPFAPTMVWLIRRRAFCRSLAELERSAVLSRRVADDEMAGELSWLRTDAVTEADGTLGTVCLYQAVDADTLRRHAARVGMPADEVVPVLGCVVYRQEPPAQPDHLRAVAA